MPGSRRACEDFASVSSVTNAHIHAYLLTYLLTNTSVGTETWHTN